MCSTFVCGWLCGQTFLCTPLALDYYIVANDGEPGNYGVKIIEKNSGEQAMAFDLTTKAQRVCELVEKFSQNCVTLASLMDVLADWL